MSAIVIRVIQGIDPVNNVNFVQISGDPTSGLGCPMGVGSVALRTDGLDPNSPAGTLYVKNQAADTGWTDLYPAQAIVGAAVNSGAAVALDFNTGTVQQVTLTGATPVITLQNFLPGRRYVLELTQDGQGSRVPSFSPALKGTVPSWTATAGKRDLCFLYADALGNLVVEYGVLNL